MHNLTCDFGNTKPPAGSKIDWGHPISNRLWCAYLFNEKGGTRVYDACDRAGVMSFVQVTAMPLWTAMGLQCGNGKGYVENNATVKSAENPCAADFTVRIRHVPRNWPGTYTVPIDEVNRYISIFMNGTTINFSGGGGRGGSSVQPVGELSDFVWVRKLRSGTGTHYYYRNGKQTGTEGGDTNTTWNASGHRLSLGGNPSGGGSNYDGCYHLVEIWMRALQVPEIEELWQDPYVNVDQGKLRMWSIPTGAVVANAGAFTGINVTAPDATSTSGGVHNYLYIASFDGVASTTEMGTYLNFVNTTSSFSLNTNTAHTPFNTGQSIVDASGTGKICYTLPATTDKLIVGFYYKNRLTGNLSGTILQFMEGGTAQFWLGFQSGNTGKIEMRRGGSGGTLLATTSSAVITNLTFAHIELRLRINDSIASGDVELYVDGSSVLTLSAAVDTQNTSNAYVDVVQIGNADFNGYIDDFFIIDWSTGASTQVGVSRVYNLYPIGAGNTNNFTASGGGGSGTNYQMVDEIPNSTSDYVSSSTVSDVDLYDMSNFTSTPQAIRSVQLNNLMAIMDAGARTVRGVLRVSGSNYEGSNLYPNPSYRFHPTLFTANPATNSLWTASEVNAVQAGLKIQA